MNLYRKLLLAQSPIALALAIVGVFSAVAISYLGSHSQGIMKDNYRSVLAAQRMKEAIERMDSAALFMVAGQREKGVEQVEKYRPVFEAELKVREKQLVDFVTAKHAGLVLGARWRAGEYLLAAHAARNAPPGSVRPGAWSPDAYPRNAEHHGSLSVVHTGTRSPSASTTSAA